MPGDIEKLKTRVKQLEEVIAQLKTRISAAEKTLGKLQREREHIIIEAIGDSLPGKRPRPTVGLPNIIADATHRRKLRRRPGTGEPPIIT